jgi:hypothetical protein
VADLSYRSVRFRLNLAASGPRGARFSEGGLASPWAAALATLFGGRIFVVFRIAVTFSRFSVERDIDLFDWIAESTRLGIFWWSALSAAVATAWVWHIPPNTLHRPVFVVGLFLGISFVYGAHRREASPDEARE